MLDHIRQRQEELRKGVTDTIGGDALSISDLEKSANDYFLEYFEKGRKDEAPIGSIKPFGGRNYIKTADGWKYHGKGSGAKAQEHVQGALGHHVEKEKAATGKSEEGKKKESEEVPQFVKQNAPQIKEAMDYINKQKHAQGSFTIDSNYLRTYNGGYGENRGTSYLLRNIFNNSGYFDRKKNKLTESGKQLQAYIEKEYGVYVTGVQYGNSSSDFVLYGARGVDAVKEKKSEIVKDAQKNGRDAIAALVNEPDFDPNKVTAVFSNENKDGTLIKIDKDKLHKVQAAKSYSEPGKKYLLASWAHPSGGTRTGESNSELVGMEYNGKVVGMSKVPDTSDLDQGIQKDVQAFISKHNITGQIGSTSLDLSYQVGKDKYRVVARRVGETEYNYLYSSTLYKNGKVEDVTNREELSHPTISTHVNDFLHGLTLPGHVIQKLKG